MERGQGQGRGQLTKVCSKEYEMRQTLMKKKTLQLKAIKALKEAVREVVEEHRRTGKRLSVWRNGKLAQIPASQVKTR